jgi:hypothetical protein
MGYPDSRKPRGQPGQSTFSAGLRHPRQLYMPRIRTTGFSIAPHPLMDGMHTAAGTQRLKMYLALHRHGHRSPDGCFASVATLAKETGINRDDTCLTLRWLVENGWAVRDSRPGKPSVYHLRQDEPTHPQVGTLPQVATHPEVTPPTHPQVTPPTHPQVTQTRTQEQEPKNKNPQTALEPPTPASGGTDGQGAGSGGTVATEPQGSAPRPAKTRMKRFHPSSDDIPACLLPLEAPLMAFWAEKGGRTTEAAWKALAGALERIWRDPDGGTAVVEQQLENAIQSGWTSITYANWKKYGQPLPARNGNGRSPQSSAADNVIRFLNAQGVA